VDDVASAVDPAASGSDRAMHTARLEGVAAVDREMKG
jgi:hypothetical protein